MLENYNVYKVWHKKQGRYMACFYNPDTKHRTTMSWARYQMALKLGRLPDPNLETVDHINGDKKDDLLSNLQLLDRVSNRNKSRKRKAVVVLTCPVCNKIFERERRNTHLSKGGHPTCCSRRCGGKASHMRR